MLIDCQPSLGLLTINALTAADGVIVPLECEFFSLRGVALLIQTIDKMRERLNPQLELEGILATMYDARTLHGREVLARVVEAFGDKVFHTVINRTVRFPETTVAGEPITTFAPSSAGADAYRDAGPRGGGAVSRRVSLPGADELFRTTGAAAARGCGARPSRRTRPAPPGQPRARAAHGRARPASRRPSGREQHDEKITVYVSPEELVDLEQARLALRAEHGLAVDRGRIVREASPS